MTNLLITLAVTSVVGLLFLVVDLWVAGKASKRLGPVRMILDQMEETNALLRDIADTLCPTEPSSDPRAPVSAADAKAAMKAARDAHRAIAGGDA